METLQQTSINDSIENIIFIIQRQRINLITTEGKFYFKRINNEYEATFNCTNKRCKAKAVVKKQDLLKMISDNQKIEYLLNTKNCFEHNLKTLACGITKLNVD